MATARHKARLSIGVYESGEGFWPTVVKLLDSGFTTDQLGIVSLAGTPGRLGRPTCVSADAWHRLSRVVEDVELLEGVEGRATLVASRGYVRPALDEVGALGGSGDFAVLRPDRCGTRACLAPDLEARVRDGATVLAVVSASNEQQWLSARILLERSIHPVHTHEFAARSGD